MSAYEIDPDQLYSSDSDESDEELPSAIQQPPVKRPRIQPPTTLSRSNFPSFTSSASRNNSSRPSNSSFPSFSSSARPREPSRHQEQWQNPSQQSNMIRQIRHVPHGRGRGRALTLPAHVTAGNHSSEMEWTTKHERPQNDVVVEKRVEDALSILPEDMREEFLQEEKRKEERKKKDTMSAKSGRKRPTMRRVSNSDPNRSRNSSSINHTFSSGRSSGSGSILQSLMATARKPSDDLIRVKVQKKKVAAKQDVRDDYRAAIMSKSDLLREEKKRKEEQKRRDEKQKIIDEKYHQERVRLRRERRETGRRWRRDKTVAANMRDSQYVARLERFLFAAQEDRPKARGLEYVGMKKKIPEKEHAMVTNLFKVEVVEI